MSYTLQQLQAAGQQAAAQYGVPWQIFYNQINQESGWNPNAQSGAGAEGIAQIEPSTAQGWGVNPWDPIASLFAAAKADASYFKQFGSWPNALAAYNAGPGAVSKYGGVPPYAETQNYVQSILGGIGSGIGNVLQGGWNLTPPGMLSHAFQQGTNSSNYQVPDWLAAILQPWSDFWKSHNVALLLVAIFVVIIGIVFIATDHQDEITGVLSKGALAA